MSHEQADSALVVRAGLGDVAVLAWVAPPRVLMRVRIAALLPRVGRLYWAWLDLRAACLSLEQASAAAARAVSW